MSAMGTRSIHRQPQVTIAVAMKEKTLVGSSNVELLIGYGALLSMNNREKRKAESADADATKENRIM
jgi:hypothetical protein